MANYRDDYFYKIIELEKKFYSFKLLLKTVSQIFSLELHLDWRLDHCFYTENTYDL